jgi:hypothetical protein
MESSKTSRGKHGDQTSDFSKIWCGVGMQNPNGSKYQTGQGISPWLLIRAFKNNSEVFGAPERGDKYF